MILRPTKIEDISRVIDIINQAKITLDAKLKEDLELDSLD